MHVPAAAAACHARAHRYSGERASAHNAYLQASGAEKRPNLHVTSGAHVTRVNLEGGEGDVCASGVQYIAADGEVRSAQLSPGGEVLLAAGAVQSPQILMLSGVGPRGHLESVGVEVRKDLPGLGEGLQDHPVTDARLERTRMYMPMYMHMAHVHAHGTCTCTWHM